MALSKKCRDGHVECLRKVVQALEEDAATTMFQLDQVIAAEAAFQGEGLLR